MGKQFWQLTTEEIAALEEHELARYAEQGYTMAYLRDEWACCRKIVADITVPVMEGWGGGAGMSWKDVGETLEKKGSVPQGILDNNAAGEYQDSGIVGSSGGNQEDTPVVMGASDKRES